MWFNDFGNWRGDRRKVHCGQNVDVPLVKSLVGGKRRRGRGVGWGLAAGELPGVRAPQS